MRRIPQAAEAERALIACCLIDETPITLGLCQEKGIVEESFYSPDHQKIFASIQAVKAKGITVEIITVAQHLDSIGKLADIGGLPALNQITGDIFTTQNALDFVNIVRDTHHLRRIITISMQTAERAQDADESPTTIISKLNKDLVDLATEKSSSLRPASETIPEALQKMQEAREAPEQLSGIPTGLVDIDKVLNGLQEEQLIIIAARPSIGKSSLARQISRNTAIPTMAQLRAGFTPAPVLFFGLEMSTAQTNKAMLAMESRVPIQKYIDGLCSREEIERMNEAARTLAASPLYFEDIATLSIFDIGGISRRFKIRQNLGMIVIDYLQLISPNDRKMNREQQVGEISRNAKILAKDLKVPVILLSQLNRASALDNRPPRLEDLRESGNIEQDADTVILLDQKMEPGPDGTNVPTNPNRVNAIIAKQRGGGRFVTIPLTWTPQITRFDNYLGDQQ
jgi:replicative DNA helicase